jgi:phage baseplate assembly protein W
MKNLYGTGVAFPILADPGSRWVSGPDVVLQALRSLLLTEPGERIGRPTYGCGLKRFLYSPNNVTTRTLIAQTVTNAIERDEPRVVLDGVEVVSHVGLPGDDGSRGDAPAVSDSTRLDIHIRFRLIREMTPRNLVCPFYLQGPGA